AQIYGHRPARSDAEHREHTTVHHENTPVSRRFPRTITFPYPTKHLFGFFGLALHCGCPASSMILCRISLQAMPNTLQSRESIRTWYEMTARLYSLTNRAAISRLFRASEI